MFIMMNLTMTLLQDLTSVLHEQGDIVDSIVSNIETTSVMVATEHGLQLVFTELIFFTHIRLSPRSCFIYIWESR